MQCKSMGSVQPQAQGAAWGKPVAAVCVQEAGCAQQFLSR